MGAVAWRQRSALRFELPHPTGFHYMIHDGTHPGRRSRHSTPRSPCNTGEPVVAGALAAGLLVTRANLASARAAAHAQRAATHGGATEPSDKIAPSHWIATAGPVCMISKA